MRAAVAGSASTQRTRVVIVGAGPAGLTIANILRAASVGCVLLEIDTGRPSVSYTDPETGERRRIDCDVIAGCDGARGVTRDCLPPEHAGVARHDYGDGRTRGRVRRPLWGRGIPRFESR
ncbi:FAD-dependent monooxygenase [Streptosporangium canum]|uniref:FAD-dependent monooxygenase n=1 Tax=Streptosporangium canum TaxID=324952 RepID=UPI00341B4C59